MTPGRRRLDTELLRRGMAASRSEGPEAHRATAGDREWRARGQGVAPGRPGRAGGGGGATRPATCPGAGTSSRPRWPASASPRPAAAPLTSARSTGGFTDCLLQHGAGVRGSPSTWAATNSTSACGADPRVTSLERTDVRSVTADAIGGPAEIVVADVSFISLRLVAADLYRLATADIVVLVKPQFEAGRAEADRGRGVIRDPEVWHRALLGVCRAVVGAGAAIMGVMVSPLTGAEGQRGVPGARRRAPRRRWSERPRRCRRPSRGCRSASGRGSLRDGGNRSDRAPGPPGGDRRGPVSSRCG